MTQANTGNTVRVHYTGQLADGRQFDSSEGRDPLEFEIGAQQVIPGFEQAVVGMEPGDSKQVTIPPEKAYGPYQENLVFQVGREQIPPDMELSVGQQLQLRDGEQVMGARVTQLSQEQVTLDANHPLAGQDLVFDIELVEVA